MKARIITWENVKAGDTFLHPRTGLLRQVVSIQAGRMLIVSWRDPGGSQRRELQVSPKGLVAVRE